MTVLSFGLGAVIVESSEAQDVLTHEGNTYDCYSASSGTVPGAYFYDCTKCEKQPDKSPTGNTRACVN